MATSTLLLVLLALGQVDPAETQDGGAAETKPLIVATKESPPFSFRDTDGQWTGISVELWRHMADELGLKYEFREMPLDQMFEGLEKGNVDVAVAAISVTADRHKRVDFCHPYFTTGLGVAVDAEHSSGGWRVLRRIISTRLLTIVSIMIGIVLVCGILFWFFERQSNEQMFGGKRRKGIGMGMWWSTIVLLGHKGVFPVSVSGRILACGAMLASILLFSILTGVITSALTIGHMDVGISHPGDLRRVKTITVEPSTSADFLRGKRIPFRSYPTIAEAAAALAGVRSEALVYDEAQLRYLANSEYYGRIHVLSVSFHTQDYAIALKPGSPLRKPLNQSLLNYRASEGWNELVYRYLGEDVVD
ncbi:transporter substrate-binding domain-containing protein [Symmachiella dynata]|uniref:transporter substrate-binding domain-containing protein n=1 Tax=Symmachiella dynata TaxID=2527995 RepID=UPI0030ECE8F3